MNLNLRFAGKGKKIFEVCQILSWSKNVIYLCYLTNATFGKIWIQVIPSLLKNYYSIQQIRQAIDN